MKDQLRYLRQLRNQGLRQAARDYIAALRRYGWERAAAARWGVDLATYRQARACIDAEATR